MKREYFFISGLPRTCSTLLCNILAQNEELFVTKATSGCHDFLFNIRNLWNQLIEHQAEGINHEQLRNVMKGAMENYYLTTKKYVVDKGRGWLSVLEMAEFVLEKKAKIIVPVRDIKEILASFEQLYRNSVSFTQWEIEKTDYFKTQTVKGRCELWSQENQPVGLAFNKLKDAIDRGFLDRMYFMEMDNLTNNPEQEMKNIYNFLEIDYYKHDFDNVEQITKEDDTNVHNLPGLHTIRSKVLPVRHKATEILGPSVCNTYNNIEFWRNIKPKYIF